MTTAGCVGAFIDVETVIHRCSKGGRCIDKATIDVLF